MSSRFERGLRRIVDSLQRGLFDESEAPAPAAPVTAPPVTAPPACASPPAAPAPWRPPQATREVVTDGERIAFRLVRVRRRSIGFVVDAGGLAVRAPKWVSLRDIDAAVVEKRAWIAARLAEQRERTARAEAARIAWRDGASIRYLGRPVTIVLDGDGERGAGGVALAAPSVAGSPARLVLVLPRDADEARVRDAAESWLQREARRVFAARIEHFAARLGVRVTRLSLSSATTRWGSAGADGSVRLHWRLIEHPLATIDYVVAHELAHLREMNHGPRFWAVVRSVLPEFESARASLREQERAGLG